MAGFDRQKIYDKAIKYATDKELIFITEIITYLPCNKTSFYTFFPDGSHELNSIKDILEVNRVDLKRRLRRKMEKDGKSADNIVLYKLAGTKEERDILNNTGVAEADKKPDHKIRIEYVPSNNEK